MMCRIFAEAIDTTARLEIAMKIGNVDCVRYIHQNCRGTFTARALKLAAGSGALECLQYVQETVSYYEFVRHNEIFTEAVRNGHMECVIFLECSGFSVHHDSTQPDPTEVAAASGQFEILKYLHSQKFSMRAAAIAAADAGHIDCLEYALKSGALLRGESYDAYRSGSLAERLACANQTKLLPLVLSRKETVSQTTAYYVAQTGNVKCLKLCIERGAPPSITVIAAAAKAGSIACLQHLHQICAAKAVSSRNYSNWLVYAAKVCRIGYSSLRPADVAQMAAHAQRWECLRFLITHECPMDKSLTTSLVQAGQIELYYLAVAHGCGVSVRAACQFVADGNLALLQHALEHGCEPSVEILRATARHGQLQCLIYAHAQGCPWSSHISAEAAHSGHLNCLQYLHEHGCPWDARVRARVHKKCIREYADAHGCPPH